MFNFDDAKIETGPANKYLDAGIHEVKITEYKVGTNSVGNGYVDITVKNEDGSTAQNRYSLSQTVNPGKQKCAWDITKNQLFQLCIATGTTQEKFKEKTSNVTTQEQLVEVLSALSVGKPFRIKLIGEETIYKNSTFVRAKFANGRFAETIGTNPTNLKFNPERDIKRLPPVVSTTVSTEEVTW
jgi:hypothetical protein